MRGREIFGTLVGQRPNNKIIRGVYPSSSLRRDRLQAEFLSDSVHYQPVILLEELTDHPLLTLPA